MEHSVEERRLAPTRNLMTDFTDSKDQNIEI